MIQYYRVPKNRGLHTWIHTPEAINPPAFQQSPPVPRCVCADFKIFKNRLPNPLNGMSPSRLGGRKNSLPLLPYMEQLPCQNIRRFRRCSKTAGLCPRPNGHDIHSALAHGHGIRFGAALIVTAGWLDTPVHDHGGFVQPGSNPDVYDISGFHQAGLFGSAGKLQTLYIQVCNPVKIY